MDRQQISTIKYSVNFLTLVEQYTHLKRQASTDGGEYAGPCPRCGGTDRFRVWPNSDNGAHFWCRDNGGEGCGWRGDAIEFVQQMENLNFAGALEFLGKVPVTGRQIDSYRNPAKPNLKEVAPPNEKWQQSGRLFVEYAQEQLQKHPAALDYLHRRGLSDETIQVTRVGYNPKYHQRPGDKWGVDGTVHLPQGWVFPWFFRDKLWRIGIRKQSTNGGKMLGPKGYSAGGLYLADDLDYQRPVVLLEGEIDALSVKQVASALVVAVATGSTHHARYPKWIARLSMCPLVLVAFDNDAAGDSAAKWWLDALPNARRWRPWFGDANNLLVAGELRRWIRVGLETDRIQ